MNLSNTLRTIYSEKINSGKGFWYGGSEARTSVRSIFYNKEKETELHKSQMKAAKDRLLELATATWDGNHRLVVELIYSRSDGHRDIIAYRFTSDWAADRYSTELACLGSVLERGPFVSFVDELDPEQLPA